MIYWCKRNLVKCHFSIDSISDPTIMELSTVQKNLVKMGGEEKGGGGEAKGTDW